MPALQLIPVMRWWSPHYLYVPLAFLALSFGRGVERVTLGRPSALIALGGAFVAYFALSFAGSARYASDERLFRAELEREPACREAAFYLGELARVAGRYGEAARHYARASTGVPGYLAYVDEGAALQNLGAVRLAVGELAAARVAFVQALARPLEPLESRQLLHNIAVIALAQGDAAEAARLLESETRRSDALPESRLVRERALQALAHEREAGIVPASGAHDEH